MIRTLCAFLLAVALMPAAVAGEPRVHSRTLDNGLRVTYLHVADSPSLSIFTLLPLGLASDGPGQTQWSHLLEHMVLRSTIPDGTRDANAETLSDHMRLDYYTTVENWRTALSHHARWLAGLPLPAERLAIEKQRANSEADYVAENLVCHKFAVAAWNQAMHHGRSHVGVKQDLADAPLDQLERYREGRLVVLEKTRICAVGGIEPKQLLDAVANHTGGLRSLAKAPEGIAELKARDVKATWDLSVRHLLVSWPIVSAEKTADYAALMAAAQVIMARAAFDDQLKKLCGPVMAGVDLTCPEGTHFYVSATLRPDTDATAARARLEKLWQPDDNGSEGVLAMVARQLAQLCQPSLLSMLQRQTPDSSMAEAQFGLTWGTYDFRIGLHRAALVNKLERQNSQTIQLAMKSYLLPATRSTLLLVPK